MQGRARNVAHGRRKAALRRARGASRGLGAAVVCACALLVGAVGLVGAQATGRALDRRALRAVGYESLRQELGERTPDGRGVRVMQVEVVGQGDDGSGWAPDAGHPDLRGVRFRLPGLPSGHATDVARIFYGARAIACGVTEVDCYPNVVWGYEPDGLLRTGSRRPPMPSACRVVNHSWNGEHGHAHGLELLQRVDFVAAADDVVHVAGANNRREVPDALQCAYNVILVGRSDGHHSAGTNDLGETVYTSGRAKPDIVAPAPFTSLATPMVASAAAALVSHAHGRGAELSCGSYTAARTGRRVWHAETAEVIKAVLMAGARRNTPDQPRELGRLVGYRKSMRHQAANGLDTRYGAGQLDVYAAWRILAAGEQDAAGSAAGPSGQVGPEGFDYVPAFGGADGTARSAAWRFAAPERPARLQACLSWHLRANAPAQDAGAPPGAWTDRCVLHNLDLLLYDLDAGPRPVARSTSEVDNTENVWCRLEPGHRYELRVVATDGQPPFRWDFAIAWRAVGAP